MRKGLVPFIVLTLLASCKTEGVKKDPGKEKEMEKLVNSEKQEDQTNLLDETGEPVDFKELDGGITIKWFKHGEGDEIGYGDMLAVDYKVELNNGEVIDGNHLLRKESVPFMVGFNMQTKGWDIALKEMKVGDHAEIFIPSKLARGEKEVKGLFPPNSDNVLKIRVLNKIQPDRERDGNKVWLFEENPANKLKFGETNEIEFHTMGFTPSNPVFVNTFMTNQPFSMKLEDQGVVPGLKKALINAKRADRIWVYVPSAEAYGSKGYQDLVKPNEDVLYNVLVVDVHK